MPTLDTSNWPDSGSLFTLTTSALNAYATNGSNQWTLTETINRNQVGNDRQWSGGLTIINHPFQTAGRGKSVRPPQRFTIPLTGGGHMHFIPDLQDIELYGAVQEGSSGIPTPTGVIGLGFETYRTHTGDVNPAPTGNDAQVELDIVIYDASETNRYAALSNFTISTTGLGTNHDPTYSAASIIWRGALGTTQWERTYLVHNTQSNAWTFGGGWNLTGLWNAQKLGIAYRIHSPVAPYTLGNEVPHVSPANAIAQQGIYAATPQVDHVVSIDAPARAAASPVVQFTDDTTQHSIQAHGEASTTASIATDIRTPITAAIEAPASTAYELQVNHQAAVQPAPEGQVMPSYRLTIMHNSSIIDEGGGGAPTDSQEGFLITAGRRLWKRLGLPV